MWKESSVQRMRKSRNNKLMRLTRSNSIRDKKKEKVCQSHVKQ
jgi:hypothetical protein